MKKIISFLFLSTVLSLVVSCQDKSKNPAKEYFTFQKVPSKDVGGNVYQLTGMIGHSAKNCPGCVLIL